MNKKTLRIAGWALGLSMAVAGIGAAVGTSQWMNEPIETKAEGLVVGERVTSSNFVAGKTVIFGAADKSVYVDSITTGSTGWLKVNGGDAMVFTLGGAASSASLQTSAGKYIGFSGTKNVSLSDDSTTKPFYVTAAGVICVGSDSNELQYNASSKGFRVYSNNSNKKSALFYADYKYTVTYDANGGECATNSELVSLGGHPTLPTPTRINYAFDGWRIDDAGDYLDSSYVVTADINLVAHWTPTVTLYTVTYNANGGSCGITSEEIIKGNHPSLPTPTWAHHSFDGWQIDGEGAYITSLYEVLSDLILVAHWTEDAKYSITYTAGENGTGEFVDTDQYVGDYTLLSFGDLKGLAAKAGYRFKNYSVGGVEKEPGETISLVEAETIVVNFEVIPLEAIYDFVTNFDTYASGWSNSYSSHEINGAADLNSDFDAKIVMPLSTKQTSNITTMPVVADQASGDVLALSFELKEDGYLINNVSVAFVQWASKTPTMKLFKGAEVAGDALDSGVIGTKNTLVASSLQSKKFVVACNDGGTSRTQVGISSISITLQRTWSKLLLEKFTCSGPVELNVDPTGGFITAGNPSELWDEINLAFANSSGLSAAEKEALKTKVASVSGTVDEQALARYDLVIRKYGTGTYTDFLGRFSEGGINYGAYRVEEFNLSADFDSSLPIIITIASAGFVVAGSAFLFTRKRRNED